MSVSPSNGSAAAVEAWRAQLLRNQGTSGADLANYGVMGWDDLLGDGGPGVPADLETLDAMRQLLGVSSGELPNPARFTTGGL